MSDSPDVQAAAAAVKRAIAPRTPRVAIVLGSGLGFLGDEIQDAVRVKYAAIPGFPQPGVVGHAGELIAGTLDGVPVLAQSGRFHLYEGHPPAVAALPVRVFHALGITTVILTNAAGGIRRTFTPGTLMLIADHLNMMGLNPLVGAVAGRRRAIPRHERSLRHGSASHGAQGSRPNSGSRWRRASTRRCSALPTRARPRSKC